MGAVQMARWRERGIGLGSTEAGTGEELRRQEGREVEYQRASPATRNEASCITQVRSEASGINSRAFSGVRKGGNDQDTQQLRSKPHIPTANDL